MMIMMMKMKGLGQAMDSEGDEKGIHHLIKFQFFSFHSRILKNVYSLIWRLKLHTIQADFISMKKHIFKQEYLKSPLSCTSSHFSPIPIHSLIRYSLKKLTLIHLLLSAGLILFSFQVFHSAMNCYLLVC